MSQQSSLTQSALFVRQVLTAYNHIIESKAANFDPTKFIDRYEEAVVAMLKEKQAGMPPPKVASGRTSAKRNQSDGRITTERGGGK
jgi:non-homologous end joining protein Ku